MPQHVSWDAIEAIERGSYRVLLYGPPGTGKTRSAYNTARALGKALYNITLSDETPAAELRGHFVPQGNVWAWMHGPAVKAAIQERKGAVLLLDEIDKASQDCLDFLHGLLNDPDVAQLTLPTGETLFPNKRFQVIATMNGDLEDLQPSLQDRFKIAIEVTEPHPNAIASLPQDLQGAAANVETYGVKQRPATIRAWAAFATLRELPDVGPENAAKAVFAHRAKELMDAIGFKSTLTDVVDEEKEDVNTCACEDCTAARALAWYRHEYEVDPEYDESDETWQCASCGNWYSSESEAVHCCFDDEAWQEFCRNEGRPAT